MIGKNKRAMLGEGLLMIYRLVLITFIALIVLGASAVFYDYYLDVRDSEVNIMAREVMNCLAPEGVVDLGRFEGAEKKFMSECDFDEEELKRFYIYANFSIDGKGLQEFENGDSGVSWIKKLFRGGSSTKSIDKYEPGFVSWTYPVVILGKGSGEVKLEVYVNHEF